MSDSQRRTSAPGLTFPRHETTKSRDLDNSNSTQRAPLPFQADRRAPDVSSDPAESTTTRHPRSLSSEDSNVAHFASRPPASENDPTITTATYDLTPYLDDNNQLITLPTHLRNENKVKNIITSLHNELESLLPGGVIASTEEFL